MLTLAVAGNPNSGKTTLFNRLTGLRQKVANYAGVTVEQKTGTLRAGKTDIRLIDLPGTYSLSPDSEEERIAAQVILGLQPETPALDGVLCVLDSTALEKSLYLALQILESGVPCMLLLNMSDELHRRGASIDAALLSRLMKVPVLEISATQGTGLDELRHRLETWHAHLGKRDSAGTLLVPTQVDILKRRIQAKQIARSVLKKDLEPNRWSDRIDAVTMHRVWGPLIFGAVVLLVFQAIFTWAQPLMDVIDGFFGHAAQGAAKALPPSLLSQLIYEGIIPGVGSIVIFLPQILIVFFFIALLEQSGYLARAALVMDRTLSSVGLQGKSFLPLISSYACAVPGIMATRTIENKRDRLATILIAPLMTCSARLPVYTLLISAFIPDKPLLGPFFGMKAATMLGLYALGFLAAMATAWLLKSSILKSDRTPFFIEIPPYRWPMAKTIFLIMWDRARVFLRRAGTIILLASIVLWVLATFPRHPGEDHIRNSFAGMIGRAIEPVIEPLGFNWKIGVGLLSAQAAREVIVSSLATIYHVEADDNTTDLQEAIKTDLTPLAAVSLMVFFAFAMQCASTLAVARRETGGWKIPAAMFVYMNLLAYVASLLVYQGGKLLGLG